MKIKIAIFLLLSWVVSTNGLSQTSISVSDSTSQRIFQDHVGNSYRIVKKDTLVKFNQIRKGLNVYQYSNARLGNISSINIQNPLQPIVNHSKLSTLVLLDNTLRETNRLFLPDIGIYSTSIAFAQGYDNSLWIYDDASTQLVRVNNEGAILSRTQPLLQDLFFVPIIQSMQTNEEYIVLEDSEKGFIVLDQYGEYIKLIPPHNFSNWKLEKNNLVMFYEEQKIVYPIEGVLAPE